MKRRLLVPGLVVMLALMLGSGLHRLSALSASGVRNTRWAAVLCAFSDQPGRPATLSAITNWVTAAGKGQGGLWDYWHDVSYGQLDLTGSTVVTDPAATDGWFPMPHPLTYYNQFSWTTNPTRRALIFGDCARAAQGSVSFAGYYGILALLNTQAAGESGALATGPISLTLNGQTQSYGAVVLDPGAWDDTFAAHEMGHGYGLPHSWADNPDTEYGDPYDVMSALAVDHTTGPVLGSGGFVSWAGPGLNAPNLDKLGVLDPSRVVTASPGMTNPSVELAALNRPGANGYLMAKVPDPSDASHYYTVEFRQKSGWDKGIPQDTVLVHEVRANGLNYLVRYGGGPALGAGQAFDNAQFTVQIHVECINSAAGTATVTLVIGRYSGCGQGSTPNGAPNPGSGGGAGGGGGGSNCIGPNTCKPPIALQ